MSYHSSGIGRPSRERAFVQVALEGEEVAHRARPQRREQPRALDRDRRALRRAGLDVVDHVAVEGEVDDRVGPRQSPDPRAGAGVVGHETHCRTASSILT